MLCALCFVKSLLLFVKTKGCVFEPIFEDPCTERSTTSDRRVRWLKRIWLKAARSGLNLGVPDSEWWVLRGSPAADAFLATCSPHG